MQNIDDLRQLAMVRTELQDMSLGRCNSKGMNSSGLVSSMSLEAKTQPKSVSLFLLLNTIFIFFLLSPTLCSKNRRNIRVNCGM